MTGTDRILVPGRNCFRVETASRVSFLVDGASYFEAFAAAVERARRAVWIVGWDVHSRTSLDPGGGEELELGRFLHGAVRSNPELRVFVLEWDFSFLFALERDWTPVFRRGDWLSHRRLQFRFDDRHPFGASQHQKLVVIDDALAFAGGMDLTVGRWDTTEHAPGDPRRRYPDGTAYAPFHDVQIAVEGPAARALGELVRERWREATGRRLLAPDAAEADPWPPDLPSDGERLSVGISRTEPEHDGRAAVREIEQLTLDAIGAARRVIYVENQYFTSPRVASALEARLREPGGPEVVLVLPLDCHGWLEESTMGALRARILLRLKDADVHDRLRAVYPVVGGDEPVNVHSKVLVVDDRLARVGSSNLSNRSMGLDRECDLSVESHGSEEAARAIRSLRDRLVGEHLGWSEREVAARLEAEPSLARLVDGAGAGGRALRPIDVAPRQWAAVVPDETLVDPESPESPGRVAQEFVREDVPETTRHPWIRVILVLAGLLVLASAWQWTPLGAWIEPERLAALADTVRHHALAPLLVVLVYVTASLLMVPITGLILATALVFDPWEAIVYSLLGSLAAGIAGFAIGHLLARDTVRRLAGSRLNRLSQLLARRGVLAVMALRVLPAGPFTMTNIVAGASHIGWRDFSLGSAIGLAPGIVAVNLFKAQVERAIRDPGWVSVLLSAMALAVIVLGLAGARRVLKSLDEDDGG